MKKRIALLILIPLLSSCQTILHRNVSGPAVPLKVEDSPITTNLPKTKNTNENELLRSNQAHRFKKNKKNSVFVKKQGDSDKTQEEDSSADAFLCQESVFYDSWVRQFDSTWLSKNKSNYNGQSAREKALEQARTDAFIRLVYPSIEKTGYDFPMEINSQVLSWIRYFSGQGRKNFVVWLKRGQTLIPQMSEILENHGLPKDLVYLSMIESGFNPTALSTASAVGLWQFRSITANEYGLQINPWVDERRDPIKSTKAAAKLLTNLYTTFGSWHLAAASYNCGPGCVRKTLKNYGKDSSYFELTSMGVVNKQTAEYVPKIIAAMIVAKNPEKFGFDSKEIPVINETKTVALTKSVSLKELAESIQVDNRVLEQLNPQLKTGITPPAHMTKSGQFDLVVPASKYDVTLAQLNELPDASLKRVLVAKRKHHSFSEAALLTRNKGKSHAHVALASVHLNKGKKTLLKKQSHPLKKIESKKFSSKHKVRAKA